MGMKRRNEHGHTLLEVTITLIVMGLLAASGLVFYRNTISMQERVQVETALDSISAAQRAYLQRNPTFSYSNLTTNHLYPYLPGNSLPSQLSGWNVTVNVRPPRATKGNVTYTASQ
jgi:prepilin-type N-terminal cleavage/methylation domain